MYLGAVLQTETGLSKEWSSGPSQQTTTKDDLSSIAEAESQAKMHFYA